MHSDWPRITIITPSYNQGEFLDQTIDSVLSQGYPNLEYFIIDAGSQDNSVEIIKKHQKHLAWWISEPDQGQSDAINKGIKRATGAVINWLNSDDYYEPDSLEVIGNCFRDPATKVVMGSSQLFNQQGAIAVTKGTDTYYGNLAKTIGWARIDQPETFFRKESFEAVGRLNPKLRFVMDKEWWIRYLFRFGLDGIYRVKNVLVNFRHHSSSKTMSQSDGFGYETMGVFLSYCREFGLKEEAALLDDLMEGYKDIEIQFLPNIDFTEVKGAIHYYLLLAGNQFYHQNKKMEAAKCLNLVKAQMIKPEDRNLLRKLTIRNRYLPLWLLKALRKP